MSGARHFYVFMVMEREPDKDDLGPTYRLVVNLHDNDGRWEAKTPQEAIRLAAKGRDEIYAAFPADSAVIDRWPITIDEYARA